MSAPVAARLVEGHLRELLHSHGPRLSVIVVFGAAGNGVRTLIRDRVPQMVHGHAMRVYAGAWPDPCDQKTVLLCETVEDLPLSPPPSTASGVCVVVGCHRIEALPEWVRALPGNARTIVQLDTLSHAELQTFLNARLGGPVASTAIREIGGMCGFVPAQVAALTQVLAREGVLMPVEGTWTLVSPVDTRLFLPLLRNALAGFDTPTIELFLYLCLVGAAARDTLPVRSREQLRVLELAGLIAVEADGRSAVRSRLLAEAGQQLSDPVTTSTVYARALERPDPPEQVVLWALRHYHSVPFEAVQNVLQHLLSLHEWRAALHLASLALESADWSPNTSNRHSAELLLAKAVTLRFLDESEDAIAALSDVEHLATALPDAHDLRIRAVVQRAEILHYKVGDVDAALDALRTAHAHSLDTHSHHRGTLAGHHTLHLLYAGRFQEAASPGLPESSGATTVPRHLRTRIAIAQCLALVAEGRIRRAFTRTVQMGARQLLPLPRKAWVTEELSAAYFVSALRKNGPTQLRLLMRQFEGKNARDYRPDDTSFQLARATWLLATGNLGQAERESTNCHANTQFHDPSGMAQAVAALRAHTAALRGDSRTARAMSTEAQRLPPRSSAVIAGGVSAHLSAVRYLLGQADASAHTLLMAKDHILTGSYGFAAEALYSGVRFGDREAAAALISLQSKVDGPLVELHTMHAQAVQDFDPVALIHAGEALHQAGLLLHAFEAYGLVAHLPHAIPVPEVTARRAAYEAAQLADKMRLVAHPFYLNHTASPVATLTPREREVQQLILAGLTNREIAVRLNLSARTVEGHISRLYRKTGEKRRAPGRRIRTTNEPHSVNNSTHS